MQIKYSQFRPGTHNYIYVALLSVIADLHPFDMRVVRSDLERFVKDMGYEPVLFERGHVPYGKEEPLEEYCYREVSTCDILVAIIGGKYGTQSKDEKHSITQRELKAALVHGKQVYTFVERSVHAEYKTYQHNRDLAGFRATSVNDVRVFHFLEEVYALPGGNPVEAFEISGDITRYLMEQWAGLFQRLLQESARQKEIDIIENLNSTAVTLNHLVTFLSQQRDEGDSAIREILLSTHPAFTAIKKAAQIPYRVLFHNLDELNSLLSARSFRLDEDPEHEDCHEWDNHKAEYGIRVSKSIFDETGKLKVITPEDWKDKFILRYPIARHEIQDESIPEDDMPF